MQTATWAGESEKDTHIGSHRGLRGLGRTSGSRKDFGVPQVESVLAQDRLHRRSENNAWIEGNPPHPLMMLF